MIEIDNNNLENKIDILLEKRKERISELLTIINNNDIVEFNNFISKYSSLSSYMLSEVLKNYIDYKQKHFFDIDEYITEKMLSTISQMERDKNLYMKYLPELLNKSSDSLNKTKKIIKYIQKESITFQGNIMFKVNIYENNIDVIKYILDVNKLITNSIGYRVLIVNISKEKFFDILLKKDWKENELLNLFSLLKENYVHFKSHEDLIASYIESIAQNRGKKFNKMYNFQRFCNYYLSVFPDEDSNLKNNISKHFTSKEVNDLVYKSEIFTSYPELLLEMFNYNNKVNDESVDILFCFFNKVFCLSKSIPMDIKTGILKNEKLCKFINENEYMEEDFNSLLKNLILEISDIYLINKSINDVKIKNNIHQGKIKV